MPVKVMRLEGERFELALEDSLFPKALKSIPHPPARLYGVGRPGALAEGLAVVGARRATPYGRGCAKRFAAAAAERGEDLRQRRQPVLQLMPDTQQRIDQRKRLFIYRMSSISQITNCFFRSCVHFVSSIYSESLKDLPGLPQQPPVYS